MVFLLSVFMPFKERRAEHGDQWWWWSASSETLRVAILGLLQLAVRSVQHALCVLGVALLFQQVATVVLSAVTPSSRVQVSLDADMGRGHESPFCRLELRSVE